MSGSTDTGNFEIRQRMEKAEWVLQSAGFRRCDIPACNCGSWHQVGGYAERFREIREAVQDAGYSMNGKTLLVVINEILAASKQPIRRRIVTEEGCMTCAELARGGFGPSHDPSPRCESGKRPHCTCDVCF